MFLEVLPLGYRVGVLIPIIDGPTVSIRLFGGSGGGWKHPLLCYSFEGIEN